MMRILLLAAGVSVSALSAGSPCIGVGGGTILARDLAVAWPAFAKVPPETELVYSPVPGATRVLRSQDLERLASRYQVAWDSPRDVCVQRRVAELTESQVRSAILSALSGGDATIEVTDYFRGSVPEGQLVFPLNGVQVLRQSTDQVLWKGHVLYDRARKFPVWVRARISMRRERLTAAQDIRQGQPIDPEKIHKESANGFMLPGRGEISSLAEVEGRVARRLIHSGAAIVTDDLDAAPVVRQGDVVDVTANAGMTQLSLAARAESSGRPGQSILFRNPTSGKTFTARVLSAGKAVVDASGARSVAARSTRQP